jgi:hypothetical protein
MIKEIASLLIENYEEIFVSANPIQIKKVSKKAFSTVSPLNVDRLNKAESLTKQHVTSRKSDIYFE